MILTIFTSFGMFVSYLIGKDILVTMIDKIQKEIEGMIQDAPPPDYEESNYDAGYVAGLAAALDTIKENRFDGDDDGHH